MRRLVLALQFMTRIPMPNVRADEEDFAAAIRWFPAAGLAVGACVAVGWWIGAQRDPSLAALLALIVWVAVTGALHLDGLGDIADAAGAAHGNRERLSAVLADPHIGSFGVIAITLQLLAKFVLLQRLDAATLPPLLLVPAFARIGPLAWTMLLPPLHEGLGSRFRSGLRIGHLALWSGCAILAASALPALLMAVPAIALWAIWLRCRIGGISGDGHGAGIELCETMLLAALVLT